MKKIISVLGVLVCTLFSFQMASAIPLTNGGFETGDFTGKNR